MQASFFGFSRSWTNWNTSSVKVKKMFKNCGLKMRNWRSRLFICRMRYRNFDLLAVLISWFNYILFLVLAIIIILLKSRLLNFFRMRFCKKILSEFEAGLALSQGLHVLWSSVYLRTSTGNLSREFTFCYKALSYCISYFRSLDSSLKVSEIISQNSEAPGLTGVFRGRSLLSVSYDSTVRTLIIEFWLYARLHHSV